MQSTGYWPPAPFLLARFVLTNARRKASGGLTSETSIPAGQYQSQVQRIGATKKWIGVSVAVTRVLGREPGQPVQVRVFRFMCESCQVAGFGADARSIDAAVDEIFANPKRCQGQLTKVSRECIVPDTFPHWKSAATSQWSGASATLTN